MRHRLRFHTLVESEDAADKLEAFAKAYEMGAKLKASEVMETIGASIPGPTDEVLHRDAGQQGGGAGVGDPSGGGAFPGFGPGVKSGAAGDGQQKSGDTGHGTVGDGSMGSISGNNTSPGLLAEHPTAAGLEDRLAKPQPAFQG